MSKKISHFLIYSNLLIASAAIAQCMLTYLVFDEEMNNYVLMIEGCATLLLYNLTSYLSLPKKGVIPNTNRARWILEFKNCFWIFSFFAVVLLLYAMTQIHFMTILFLGGIGVLSLLYGIPLFKVNGRGVGMRQIPGLKVFYISVIWSLSGVGLPIVEMWFSGLRMDVYVVNYLMFTKVVFLLLCTLPFDIRDFKQDQYYSVKTVPVLLGLSRSKQIWYVLLFVHTLLLCFAPYDLSLKVGLLLANGLGLLFFQLVFNKSFQKYEQVYWFDFLLVLQLVFVLLIYLLY